MITSHDLEHRLQGLYDEFLELNDFNGLLPSADDMLVDDSFNLDSDQRKFLEGFIKIWESVYGG